MPDFDAVAERFSRQFEDFIAGNSSAVDEGTKRGTGDGKEISRFVRQEEVYNGGKEIPKSFQPDEPGTSVLCPITGGDESSR